MTSHCVPPGETTRLLKVENEEDIRVKMRSRHWGWLGSSMMMNVCAFSFAVICLSFALTRGSRGKGEMDVQRRFNDEKAFRGERPHLYLRRRDGAASSRYGELGVQTNATSIELRDILRTAEYFDNVLKPFLLVFDGKVTNGFKVATIVNKENEKKKRDIAGYFSMLEYKQIAKMFASVLTGEFAGRFEKGQLPFHALFAYPDFVALRCLYDEKFECEDTSALKSPLFTFGSVASNIETKLPNALSQGPVVSLGSCVRGCYEKGAFSRAENDNNCIFNQNPWDKCDETKIKLDEGSKKFKDLIPKLYWRGSGYQMNHNFNCDDLSGYLNCNEGWSKKNKYYDGFASVQGWLHEHNEYCNASLDQLNAIKHLPPRLKIVTLSALNPNEFDCKLTKHPKEEVIWDIPKRYGTSYCQKDSLYATERGNNCNTENFKYLIDVAGWGGSSWTQTFKNLAMPGVLFHHETMAKDSYFYLIKPWVHYIPVNNDLSNLRERLAWAKNNEREAEKISLAATQFMKEFATKKGVSDHVKEAFVPKLKNYLVEYSGEDGDLIDLVEKYTNGKLRITRIESVDDGVMSKIRNAWGMLQYRIGLFLQSFGWNFDNFFMTENFDYLNR